LGRVLCRWKFLVSDMPHCAGEGFEIIGEAFNVLQLNDGSLKGAVLSPRRQLAALRAPKMLGVAP